MIILYLAGLISLYMISFSLFFYVILSRYLLPKTVLDNQLSFLRNSWEEYYGRSFARPKLGLWPKLVNSVLGNIERVAHTTGLYKDLASKLSQAGIKTTVPRFIFFHSLFVLIVGIIVFYVAGFIPLILTLIILAILPIMLVSYRANKQKNRLGKQLPELLTIVAGLLNAGHGFFQAIDAAVKEMAPPISYEFKKVLTDARLGISIEDALDKMARRVQNRDYDWLIIAVKIQRQSGGNLAEILEMLAKTIKDREQLEGQMKTLTAEGRYSAYILIGMPIVIGMILYVMNPEYIGLLFTNTTGQTLIGGAIVLMLFGIVWLKKIVTIKV